MSIVLCPEGCDPELIHRLATYDGSDEEIRQMIAEGRVVVFPCV